MSGLEHHMSRGKNTAKRVRFDLERACEMKLGYLGGVQREQAGSSTVSQLRALQTQRQLALMISQQKQAKSTAHSEASPLTLHPVSSASVRL